MPFEIFDNVNDPKAVFSGFDSLKDVAIGSGFGGDMILVFVFRVDVGFKPTNPISLNERFEITTSVMPYIT